MTSLPVRQKTRILKEKKESFRDSLGKEKKKGKKRDTRLKNRTDEHACL